MAANRRSGREQQILLRLLCFFAAMHQKPSPFFFASTRKCSAAGTVSLILFADAPFTGAGELNQMPDFGQRRELGFDPFQAIRDRQPFPEKNFVGLL